MIVFRKTDLDNARHIAFSQQLGKRLEVNPFFYGKENDRLGEPFLFDVAKFVNLQAKSVVATDKFFQYSTRWISCETKQPSLASQRWKCPLAHCESAFSVSAFPSNHALISDAFFRTPHTISNDQSTQSFSLTGKAKEPACGRISPTLDPPMQIYRRQRKQNLKT